jgi:hypothetical protein
MNTASTSNKTNLGVNTGLVGDRLLGGLTGGPQEASETQKRTYQENSHPTEDDERQPVAEVVGHEGRTYLSTGVVANVIEGVMGGF